MKLDINIYFNSIMSNNKKCKDRQSGFMKSNLEWYNKIALDFPLLNLFPSGMNKITINNNKSISSKDMVISSNIMVSNINNKDISRMVTVRVSKETIVKIQITTESKDSKARFKVKGILIQENTSHISKIEENINIKTEKTIKIETINKENTIKGKGSIPFPKKKSFMKRLIINSKTKFKLI